MSKVLNFQDPPVRIRSTENSGAGAEAVWNEIEARGAKNFAYISPME